MSRVTKEVVYHTSHSGEVQQLSNKTIELSYAGGVLSTDSNFSGYIGFENHIEHPYGSQNLLETFF